MARSRRFSNSTRDVVTPISNQRLRYVLPIRSILTSLLPAIRPAYDLYRSVSKRLTSYEDRRTFSPLPKAIRVPRSFDRYTQLAISKPSSRHLAYPSHGISFKDPDRVLVCVRRHQRREVLHALHKTGRGGQSKPRWTAWSGVRC